ncbi:MAG TPA: SMP-30/gluconolactonase/LRE family protein [Acidimicrobiales bacterium]|nr:SMP-30/gluconolactonase/LRE family protein [Acidimicrobiales bacterium]
MGARQRVTESFVGGLRFAEGPRWHDGRLWFSDQHGLAVFSAGEDGDLHREVEVPGQPSGLGWLPDGRLLIVSMRDRRLLRLEPDGTLVAHGELSPWATFHANDMVVSADGRSYAGNFGFDLDALMDGEPVELRTAAMVRVDPDGSSHLAAEDLAFPNGTVLFPDGATLVVAESMGWRLTAFDVAADGSLGRRRVWAAFPAFGEEGSVSPDGCCLDAEGCIWVANAMAPECLRVAEGGDIVDRVATGQNAYACMLGGADRTTLYCCTAPTSHAAELTTQRSGRIEQVRVDVPGAGLP